MVRICLPIQGTQEMLVWFLGGEDPLEKEMATHSSTLTWEIPWTEMQSQTRLSTHTDVLQNRHAS